MWWIRAEEAATLAEDYASLAKELRLREATIHEAARPDQQVMIDAVRRWLEQTEQRWLLVFDNADRPSDMTPYLPRAGPGRVLITSRNPIWPGQVRALAVPVLPAADAAAFLLNRTAQSDKVTAATLAKELGHLPLALEQAAAYIVARNLTLAGYLERFRTHRQQVLERGDMGDYPTTVASTWDLSFRGAKEQAPGAEDLLSLIAFLAPDGIPLEVLTAHVDLLPDPLRNVVDEPIALDEAVVALRRYSLVEVIDDQTLAVHRLVQAVVRDQMTVVQRDVWAAAAARVIAAALPDESHNPRIWSDWERLLAHALAAAQHGTELKLSDPHVARLNGRAGIYLSARGRTREARLLLGRSVSYIESELGPNHPELAVGLHHLARVLKDLAEFTEAQALVERALAIDEAAHGPNHPEVAADLSLLGNILREQGDLVGARKRIDRAVAIREDVLGPEHPEVASGLNDLGATLRLLGDYERARGVLERALEIHESTYGPNHPEIGIDLGNLGQTLLLQGDLDGARELQERALALHEVLYGSEHPMVAIALSNLGRVLRAQGDLVGARGLLERAITIDERAYGPNHPAVATHLDNLANVFQDLGELKEAEQLYERVLAIREATFGPDHPDVATALNNLATLLQRQGDLAGARMRLERAIAIDQASLGDNHPKLAAYCFNLANVLQQQGDLGDAEQLLEKTVRIRVATVGEYHPEVGTALMALADVQVRQGNLPSARRNFQRALPIWRRIGDDQRTQTVLHSLRWIDEQQRVRPRRRRA